MALMKDKSQDLGPIPGQAFFDPPGGPAWERPPLHADVETALGSYVEKLDDDNMKEVMFSLLDNKMPLDVMVNFIVRGGTMQGLHTVETGMLLKPMLHEYYGLLAEQAGIDYVETANDLVKDRKKASSDRQMIASYMSDMSPEEDSDGDKTSEALPL